MKRLFYVFIMVPFFAFAQDNPDTSANRIVISEDAMECVNDILENPDAVKYLIQTLVSNKEKLIKLHQEIMNDPGMKEVIKEFRNILHDDRGTLDKKKSGDKKPGDIDINKNQNDYTYLKNR